MSRYKLERSQKTIKVHKYYCGQMRVSGYSNWQLVATKAAVCKNRDKLINFIDRVRHSKVICL